MAEDKPPKIVQVIMHDEVREWLEQRLPPGLMLLRMPIFDEDGVEGYQVTLRTGGDLG